MTEANHSILYLAREDYRHIHALLATWAEHQGEPIPPFALAQNTDLEALVMLPQGLFYGQPAYPTFEEKAAIIFYTINSFHLEQSLPNAQLILYPDAAHGSLFQYPELFVEHTSLFLRG